MGLFRGWLRLADVLAGSRVGSAVGPSGGAGKSPGDAAQWEKTRGTGRQGIWESPDLCTAERRDLRKRFI